MVDGKQTGPVSEEPLDQVRQLDADIELIARAGSWTLTLGAETSWWSPGLFALFELTPETAKASYSALVERIYPDDRAGVLGELATATVTHNIFERAHRMLTGAGGVRNVISRARVYFHDDGKSYFAIGTMIDVTGQVLAREQLAGSVAQLKTMWEYLPEGIVLISTGDGLIVDSNPFAERLLGFTHAEMRGRSVMSFHTPAERLRIENLVRDKTLAVPPQETVMLDRNGALLDVETSSSAKFHAGARDLIIVCIRDLAPRKRAERATQRLTATNALMANADLALVHAETRDALLNTVCSSLIGGPVAIAWLGEPLNDPRKSSRVVAFAGAAAFIAEFNFSWDESVANGRGTFGKCVRTRRIVHAQIGDADFAPWRASATESEIVTVMALPIVDGDNILVFLLASGDPEAFGPVESVLYESLAGDIAMGLRALRARESERARAVDLQAALEGALSAVSAALERRDPATAGHERRVADLARQIAVEMGLDAERIHGLYVASLVHDIGKIGIPAEIVNKPGLLTDLEYEFMKQHAGFGADIMRNIPFPWPIAEIVHQHHESLDGNGYPRGLKGSAILLETRILTVADVFESMTAFRPYHTGLDIESALNELRREAGTRFDLAVVDACVRVIGRGAFVPYPAPSQDRPPRTSTV